MRNRFKFQPYLVFLYLGIVAGVTSGTLWAAFHGLDARKVNAALLLLVIPALIGARLQYVALHWPTYRLATDRILRKSEGGAALYGGLGVALVTSVPLLALLDLPAGAFWDAGAVCLLVGMIFTKVGCLLNGCCSGRLWRIPGQLLEAGLAAAVLAGAMTISERIPFQGSLFLLALAGYGAGRFGLEPLRKQRERVNRVMSAGLTAFSGITFLIVWLGGWE